MPDRFTPRVARFGSARQTSRRTSIQLESLESRRVLATFHVAADVADGEPGSLRAAVIAANLNADDDVIELAEGTYDLTLPRVDEPYTRDDRATVLNPVGGDLDLTEIGQEIIIRGAGATTTVIDVSGIEDRAFDIASGVHAVFEGITIQGGSRVAGGGGINAGLDVNPFEATHESRGSLTIRDSILRNNRATYEGGGVNNWGTLIIERSQFIENFANYEGGGMEHGGGGTGMIIASSFINNQSNYEGAGVSVGTGTVGVTSLSIIDSTIANNRASYSGGGINAESAAVTITNSTLSDNTAGYEGDSINTNGVRVRLDHVTVVNGNSSRIGLSGPMLASNSIVVGHGLNDIGDLFSSAGNNLVGQPGPRGIRRDDGTNIIGVDPRLGPLADNGGPTLTHALLLDSPAIDKASETSELQFDQRHAVRPTDGDGDGVAVADIGAFEAVEMSVYFVNSERDAIDNNPGNGIVDTGTEGEVTLRAAVMEANAGDNPARIVLPAGTFTLDRGTTDKDNPDEDASALDDLDLYGQISIVGAGANETTVDGGRRSGVIEVRESAHVKLIGLALQNGWWNGAITNRGTLEIRSAKVLDNTAIPGESGGITNFASLLVSESDIRNNHTGPSGQGGGITNFGQATVERSTIHGNSSGAGGEGGGLANLGTATVSASTFSANSSGASGEGGAIYNESGDLSLTNSTLSGNESGANGQGGAILVASGNATIVATTIVHNSTTAGGDGGGITILANSNVRLGGTIIAQNKSGQIVGEYKDSGFNFIGGDPKLSPLQDNGGPTLTHLPLFRSPVIDAGSDFGLATDQRGVDRTFDDPRVPNKLFVVSDDPELELPAARTDGTDVGAVEATYELVIPESSPDHFYAFGAFQSNQLHDQPKSVLANDLWLRTLAAELVESPTHGTVLLGENGTFVYIPETGFRGQDEFSYVAVPKGEIPDEERPRSEPTTATIEILLAASISGQSYIDRDNDGIFDGTDAGLAQTEFYLSGLDQWGNSVTRRTLSNSSGDYRFEDLAPGTYTVNKQQPPLLTAGQLSLGNAGGSVDSATQFTIHLTEGTIASGYRFAELLSTEVPDDDLRDPIEAIGGNGKQIIGDVNFDGVFNSSDLVSIFQRGLYDKTVPGGASYQDGDWNGDGMFDSSDLVLAFQAGQYEREVDSIFWA